jgi:hypothetical protein
MPAAGLESRITSALSREIYMGVQGLVAGTVKPLERPELTSESLTLTLNPYHSSNSYHTPLADVFVPCFVLCLHALSRIW